ncbi:hypothetical protein SAMN04488564_101478 [Lentzea waywayandensis]|uniref:Spore-associated protein A n=1 Tax=Lentzea waywayandensis TaxID=84724 RepID=A0A1I6CWJ3_9PSEU|nr:hypothetical protein [Lentzea waywayandensis]SFQ97599.1 hypothetical protein SAMN04488564_101478 [Lentzea waywayandensis]
MERRNKPTLKRARFVLAGALAVVMTVLFAPSGQAAANPYTPEGVCGSGYQRVSPNATLDLKNGSALWGQTYLLYSSATKKNCVVTIKRFEVGVESYTVAHLQVQGSNMVGDAGYYEYYAGPHYAYAPGKCVRIHGVVWEDDMVRYAQKYGPYGWCD